MHAMRTCISPPKPFWRDVGNISLSLHRTYAYIYTYGTSMRYTHAPPIYKHTLQYTSMASLVPTYTLTRMLYGRPYNALTHMHALDSMHACIVLFYTYTYIHAGMHTHRHVQHDIFCFSDLICCPDEPHACIFLQIDVCAFS